MNSNADRLRVNKFAMPMQYTYLARNKKETTVRLEELGIRIYRWSSKKGEQHFFYPYSDIKRVHLFMPDMDWYTMKIRFSDRREILLRSLTFGRREHGRFISKPENQFRAYRALVLSIHQQLMKSGLSADIKFSQGSSMMTALCLGASVICLFVLIPIAWYAGHYWRLAFFILSVFILFLFSFRTGFQRPYSPSDLPEKYLPKNREG